MAALAGGVQVGGNDVGDVGQISFHGLGRAQAVQSMHHEVGVAQPAVTVIPIAPGVRGLRNGRGHRRDDRSEEHTSEPQSLMRISYDVFCLKKNTYYPLNQTNSPTHTLHSPHNTSQILS